MSQTSLRNIIGRSEFFRITQGKHPSIPADAGVELRHGVARRDYIAVPCESVQQPQPGSGAYVSFEQNCRRLLVTGLNDSDLSPYRHVGTTCISGTQTRGGSLATASTASATSSGRSAFARVSADGLTGRRSRISVSTRPGQTTHVRMPFSFSDRKSTRLNSSHRCISYAVFCLKKKQCRSGSINPHAGSSRLPSTLCAISAADANPLHSIPPIGFFLKVRGPPRSPPFPKREAFPS